LLNTSAALLGWNIVVVLALSAAAGYASWHLLETHAIALGGRISAQLQGRHPVRRAIDVPR
jgi:peptidoglycan/LPS O-acetylase OafA/YrhL